MTSSDVRPERDARAETERQTARPGGDATVDEMSDSSFPASDPPATWTWELPTPATPREP